MSLAVAIQMDPIETVDIAADSTFALALEAQARGHGLYHYLPQQLSFRNGRVYAHARPLTVRPTEGEMVALFAPDLQRARAREQPPVAKREVLRQIVEQRMPPLLRLVENAQSRIFTSH